ncbi:hypothetical protein [Synechococcus elongatus]|uniref:type IV pilus modification PilV family protein n=1 Tax=Synechococcus elongatus TaxID=32046 RepID=UPI0030D4D57C
MKRKLIISLLGHLRVRRETEQGFTLAEVIVSAVLVVLFVLATATAIAVGLNDQRRVIDRQSASRTITRHVEQVRNLAAEICIGSGPCGGSNLVAACATENGLANILRDTVQANIATTDFAKFKVALNPQPTAQNGALRLTYRNSETNAILAIADVTPRAMEQCPNVCSFETQGQPCN